MFTYWHLSCFVLSALSRGHKVGCVYSWITLFTHVTVSLHVLCSVRSRQGTRDGTSVSGHAFNYQFLGLLLSRTRTITTSDYCDALNTKFMCWEIFFMHWSAIEWSGLCRLCFCYKSFMLKTHCFYSVQNHEVRCIMWSDVQRSLSEQRRLW